jgi:putative exosortase-associated protein (TIGR04073 family)
MRQTISNLLGCAALAFVVTGCAGPEQKLGRGLTNLMEPLRGGETCRAVEQATLFESPDTGYAIGQVRGARRTIARTLLGVYEVATFPIPNTHRYAPICTGALSANPVYPDGYKPGWISGENALSTDSHLGIFDNGDVAPMFPGSRFRIFDN